MNGLTKAERDEMEALGRKGFNESTLAEYRRYEELRRKDEEFRSLPENIIRTIRKSRSQG